MLKLGIHSIGQLKSGRTRTLLGRRKRIAVRLINEIQDDDEYERLFELITCDLVDDRGSWKRTSPQRFAAFDRVAIEILKAEGFAGRPLAVHDAGVSNASTAVEFFRVLEREFPDLEYFASDYDHELTAVRDGSLVVTLSSNGTPVEITWPPFVFTPLRYEHPVIYPLNHLLSFVLRRTTVRKLLGRHRRGEIDSSAIEKIELFCPAARALANSAAPFSLGTCNLLDSGPTPRRFDCVRIMNVLNPNYFDPAQVAKVLGNVGAMLNEGGIFIAGSNEATGTPVEGGMFRLESAGFTTLHRSGDNDFLFDHIERFNRRQAGS